MQRLDTIPGVNRIIAQTLLAEVGMDLERFPTAGHLASWAGMCPGNDESAASRRSGKTRKGSPWLPLPEQPSFPGEVLKFRFTGV